MIRIIKQLNNIAESSVVVAQPIDTRATYEERTTAAESVELSHSAASALIESLERKRPQGQQHLGDKRTEQINHLCDVLLKEKPSVVQSAFRSSVLDKLPDSQQLEVDINVELINSSNKMTNNVSKHTNGPSIKGQLPDVWQIEALELPA